MTPETFDEFLLISNDLEACEMENEILSETIKNCESKFNEIKEIAIEENQKRQSAETLNILLGIGAGVFLLTSIGGIFIW